MMRWQSFLLLSVAALGLTQEELDERADEQGSSYMPVYYIPYTSDEREQYRTTLDPYTINMSLEYGRIDIYDDDRSLKESKRKTYPGWYFRPKIDTHTISLFKGDLVVMYIQVQNPDNEAEFESWSCSTSYNMEPGTTVYVGHVHNYHFGELTLNNDAVERDSQTVVGQTTEHPEYSRNGPWKPANALRWYT